MRYEEYALEFLAIFCLGAHIAEPFLEVSSQDAERIGLEAAGLAAVENEFGRAVLRVLITDRVTPGSVFAPMHWTDRFSSEGRVDSLVAPNVDPVSGQPESKHSVVSISPLSPDWFGFLVSLVEIPDKLLGKLDYWACARTGRGWRYELAGHGQLPEWAEQLCPDPLSMQVISAAGQTARASIQDNVLQTHLIASERGPVSADRTWLAGLLGTRIDADIRLGLLAGRPPSGMSSGRLICSCLGVGSVAINEAIQSGCQSVDGIGAATGAGTNCGSCKPEIRALLEKMRSEDTPSHTMAAE